MPLPLLAKLALSTFALVTFERPQPDKFWLEPPASGGQAVEGSQPAFLEGVLLDESPTHYHVRVLGGEIWLAKKDVHHVEKDTLDVATLERREREAHSAQSPQGKAEEASAKKEPTQVKPAAMPAAAPKPGQGSEAPQGTAPAPQAPKTEFDPVLGVVGPAKDKPQSKAATLEAEYRRSGDRDVLKELRRARRGR
jgi:hypothetical protein